MYNILHIDVALFLEHASSIDCSNSNYRSRLGSYSVKPTYEANQRQNPQIINLVWGFFISKRGFL